MSDRVVGGRCTAQLESGVGDPEHLVEVTADDRTHGGPHAQIGQHRFGTDQPERVVVMVGPEGGWAAAEVDLAVNSGAVPVTLGPLTLRADAVPLAAIASVRMLWE